MIFLLLKLKRHCMNVFVQRHFAFRTRLVDVDCTQAVFLTMAGGRRERVLDDRIASGFSTTAGGAGSSGTTPHRGVVEASAASGDRVKTRRACRNIFRVRWLRGRQMLCKGAWNRVIVEYSAWNRVIVEYFNPGVF